MKNQITRCLAVLTIAALSASASAQIKNLGGRFGHSHGLGWGTTNFGSTFKSRADAIAANYNTGWLTGTSFSSISAEYRARLLSSREHNVVKGRVYALANSNTTFGSTRLTIGSLDFVFWPQTGSYKSIGNNHSFSHWYAWKQWFGRLVQGKKYVAGILLKSRMSSNIDVQAQVTMTRSTKRARVYLRLASHPYVSVQVVNNSSASITGHIRPLFPHHASFTLDSRRTTTYGSGIVDYNDLVSMIMWINRRYASKVMLANRTFKPRDAFPASSYVGGRSYLGYRLF